MRNSPLIGRVSLLPCRSCKTKVDGPKYSTIWNGPGHNFLNLVWFPFSSCALSHFKIESPIWKYFLLNELASKEDFTNYWWCAWVFLAFSLSSYDFRIWDILSCIEEKISSSINCTKENERRARLGGRITYFP